VHFVIVWEFEDTAIRIGKVGNTKCIQPYYDRYEELLIT
jgi:hypothetical protein